MIATSDLRVKKRYASMTSFDLSSSKHFINLEEGYRKVAKRTWQHNDFLEKNLLSSRDLFEAKSLLDRRPIPKPLEVYALLSGLPFDEVFCQNLINVQESIKANISQTLAYWVKPENLGLEYCVFKWPTGMWEDEWLGIIDDELAFFNMNEYTFSIGGIQINPDGCIVAKGFDHTGELFRIRERMKTRLPFLPHRQSGWAHVPLGRILEPVGAQQFASLKILMDKLSNRLIARSTINSLLLIHETQWYMEKRSELIRYNLTAKEV
jgi:hypothetical protein